MIPSIEDILAMLLAGECAKEQALQWINRHVEMASESDALRDHFAGLALQGVLAQSCGVAMGSDPAFVAKYAFAAADAMIEARSA